MTEKKKPVKKKTATKKPVVVKAKTILDTLKPEHRAFVAEYVNNCGNGTLAYQAVYKDVKASTARINASKLLTNTNIIEAIEFEYDKYWKGKDKNIEKNKTYQLIHFCGDVDVADIFDDEYDIKPLNQIPPASRKAIQSVKKTERTTKYGVDRTVEVTLVNKLSALELRSKMQKMLDTKLEVGDVTITVGLAVRPDDDEEDI